MQIENYLEIKFVIYFSQPFLIPIVENHSRKMPKTITSIGMISVPEP